MQRAVRKHETTPLENASKVDRMPTEVPHKLQFAVQRGLQFAVRRCTSAMRVSSGSQANANT